MPEASRKDLSDYRLSKAKQCLAEAHSLFESSHYAGSANRSYYAIFHALRSVLALDGIDFKKHSAVISEFRKSYIKTGAFPTALSDYIGSAFTARQDSDYQDFFVVSKEDAETQINNAAKTVEAVQKYITKISKSH